LEVTNKSESLIGKTAFASFSP